MKTIEEIWELLEEEAKLTNCKKREVACVIYDTTNQEIVGMGHNHHVDGICDCKTTRTAIHAEQMARGNMKPRLRGQCIAFINHAPCSNCAKVLDSIVHEVRYRSQ